MNVDEKQTNNNVSIDMVVWTVDILYCDKWNKNE